MITAAELRPALRYDEATGYFWWPSGKRAGTVRKDGYRQIRVGGKVYLEHRLAWLWLTGEFPLQDTDHINGDRQDNRAANLRAATRAQNVANTSARKNSASGIKGVFLFKRTGRWVATIKVDGKSRHLGYFDTAEQAAKAYCRAAKNAHGNYARAA